MRNAHALLVQAEPVLADVKLAGDALGLAPLALLHAGPPLADPSRPPPTLASSIVITCLLEGWAKDEAEAEQLLRSARLSLSPAQDSHCVTPLAAVVSQRTPLLEVRDAVGGALAMYAPVSAVRGADTRMGGRDPTLLSRLQRRDGHVAPALLRFIQQHGPIALWPLALAGMAGGDDLHNRTSSANAALALLLRERGALDGLADDVAATPLFFLTLWMAACALVLRSAEDSDVASVVTRAGGNGEQFGICLSGRPGQWITCAAEPPRGPFIAKLPPETRLAGAMGDSAVIDMLGLGGQRLGLAPEPLQLLADYLPMPADSLSARASALLLSPHPRLPAHWPLGLDATAVAASSFSPLVMLAMLAEDGWGGFVGRGIYQPPVELFERALRAGAAG